MASPGFYDDNEGINYPFLDGSTGRVEPSLPVNSIQRLPKSTIVDFGGWVGLDSEFNVATHKIYLHRVSRGTGLTGNQYEFEFLSTDTQLESASVSNSSGSLLVSEYKILFCREFDSLSSASVSSLKYVTNWTEMVAVPGPEPAWPCSNKHLAEFFMVSGDLTALSELLAEGEELIGDSTEAIVEPTLIQNLDNSLVRSIGVANGERVRSTAPAGCPALVWPFTLQDQYLISECLTTIPNSVKLKEGYNATITVSEFENSITIGASVAGGIGEPCEELELFAGEAPPAGSTLLTGGPKCNEALRAINGLGGRVISLFGGRGVSVIPSPFLNHILVDVHLKDLFACPTDTSSSGSSTFVEGG